MNKVLGSNSDVNLCLFAIRECERRIREEKQTLDELHKRLEELYDRARDEDAIQLEFDINNNSVE